jgi:hypothetical protein
MTQDEEFGAIWASFPITSERLTQLWQDLAGLRHRAHAASDGSMSDLTKKQLKVFAMAVADLHFAVEAISKDIDPHDLIPF